MAKKRYVIIKSMATNKQKFLRIAIIFFLIVTFAAYGLYKARDFLTGPKITIESPKDGQTVSSSYLEVRGTAKNISSIRMNGRQIFVDESGIFKENLLLAMGYNIIEVSAEDKFGREVKENRKVVLK